MTEPKTKLNQKEYVHFKINTITETNKMCYRKKNRTKQCNRVSLKHDA